jgi:hypothetical protein
MIVGSAGIPLAIGIAPNQDLPALTAICGELGRFKKK